MPSLLIDEKGIRVDFASEFALDLYRTLSVVTVRTERNILCEYLALILV